MKDETMPDGKWAFDANVADAFDDMLARSIPQYLVMRDLSFTIGRQFVTPGSTIIDLGCSRGEALAPFVAAFGETCAYVGTETSAPMLAAARERFVGIPHVEIQDCDLRASYPEVQASLTLAVLILQFVPIEYRQHIVQNIFDHTAAGGAVILVEKVLGETSIIDRLLVDRYYAMKIENGYTQEAIDRKRLSLEGVLVPVTARWNVELLRQAGFRGIDCFWRWCNFAAWIAVR